MKASKIRNILIGGLVLLISSTAWAAPRNRGPQRVGKGVKNKAEKQHKRPHRHMKPIPFKVLDDDADGKVTYDEWVEAHDKRMEKRMKKAKKNGKKPKVTDEQLEKREERLGKIFDKIDTDDSGDLTAEEYKEALRKRQKHKEGKEKKDQGGPNAPDDAEDTLIE